MPTRTSLLASSESKPTLDRWEAGEGVALTNFRARRPGDRGERSTPHACGTLMSSMPAIDLGQAARSSQHVDLAELIDRRPMSPTQMWVAALCAATLFVDGYDIQVMALAVPSLAAAWSLPPSSFGLALSAVVIGITAGSGLLGPLGDRFGRRAMLVVTMTLVGLRSRAGLRSRRLLPSSLSGGYSPA